MVIYNNKKDVLFEESCVVYNVTVAKNVDMIVSF